MSPRIVPNGKATKQALSQSDPPNLAAVYARVSTTDQADKGYSLPTQIQACQALAQQEGDSVPESHIFVDGLHGDIAQAPAVHETAGTRTARTG